jgi:hypothetical protein
MHRLWFCGRVLRAGGDDGRRRNVAERWAWYVRLGTLALLFYWRGFARIVGF